MLNRFRLYLADPGIIKRALIRRMPGVFQSTRRAISKKIEYNGLTLFRKSFKQSPDAIICFHNEIKAREIFQGKNWIIPIKDYGENWLTLPLLSEDSRLYIAVKNMDTEMRLKIAAQAMSILLDIYTAGYLHGDFHTNNLFWYQDQLLVCDFEKLTIYPENKHPTFQQSYDLIGNTTDVMLPGNDGMLDMHYSAQNNNISLNRVLNVSLETAFHELSNHIKNELRIVCHEFQTINNRHQIRSKRIYSSFSLPFFSVSRDEAQRDNDRRLKKFGVNNSTMNNARVLDLGCNIGGIIFESQKFSPAVCKGVEFDMDKIITARRIAALNGLNNITFMQGDVDLITVEDTGGPYDIVFCLALIGHVKQPERLYQLLNDITIKTLYFEGNSSTEVKKAEDSLKKSGFSKVRYIGNCDDDCREDNNIRPLFIAEK